MSLIDYKNKVFLKLYKKKVQWDDNRQSDKSIKEYEKYFDHVLKILQPECQAAIKKVNTDINQKYFDLLSNIYVMWWQGIDHAPRLVQNNIKRMQQIFGQENVHVITQENWKEYCSISDTIISKFNDNRISITAFSDIIRFNLLKNHGGLWIDSTVILSNKSKDILSKYSNKEFFSISNKDNDYHYISKSRWTAWLVGGRPSYPLFEFINSFYEIYFIKHDFLIDYYTTDDIIAYFYIISDNFRKDIEVISNNWHPYLWSENISKIYNKNLIDEFKQNPLYGIQKFTYKYNKEDALNPQSMLYAILNSNL